jgi:uncharacterized membrane protein YhaH (DUF805 family)
MTHFAPNTIFILVPIVLAIIAIWFIPIARIVHRTGYSAWWVLLAFIPFSNIVGLWILAFARWPALDGKSH